MSRISGEQVNAMKVQVGDLVRCALCIQVREPSTFVNTTVRIEEISTNQMDDDMSMTVDDSTASINYISNENNSSNISSTEYQHHSDMREGYEAYLKIMEVVVNGMAPLSYAVADSWTKLVFLAMFNEYPITIQRLMGLENSS